MALRRTCAREIALGLEFTKKWPPEHWRLAFQGNLHQVPQEDFELIASEMKAATGARG